MNGKVVDRKPIYPGKDENLTDARYMMHDS